MFLPAVEADTVPTSISVSLIAGAIIIAGLVCGGVAYLLGRKTKHDTLKPSAFEDGR